MRQTVLHCHYPGISKAIWRCAVCSRNAKVWLHRYALCTRALFQALLCASENSLDVMWSFTSNGWESKQADRKAEVLSRYGICALKMTGEILLSAVCAILIAILQSLTPLGLSLLDFHFRVGQQCRRTVQIRYGTNRLSLRKCFLHSAEESKSRSGMKAAWMMWP